MPESRRSAAAGGDPAAYLAPAAIDFIRRQIRGSAGNEVLFLGRPGADGLVSEIRVLSRGNRRMTPAIMAAAATGDLLLHNHPSGDLTPSAADVAIAAELGARGVASLIVNNQVTVVYAVVEPLEVAGEKPLPPETVRAFFAPGGRLATVLPTFEYRRPQEEMALAVTAACNDKRLLVVEAGTGVGKSLAYLIPAALWSRENRKRVAISTNTINLQEQLLHKDLPLLTRHLEIPVQAVLVKGRGNYLCRRKLDELAGDPALLPGLERPEQELLTEITAWAASTRDGSLADLPVVPPAEIWDLCRSEADICLGVKCPRYETCFFYRARRQAANAQLLIVNHHLLFADLGLPGTGSILPRYDAVVLDEAHNLEEVATGYLGEQASRLGLLRVLGRLAHRRRPRAGVFARLLQRLRQVGRRGGEERLQPLVLRLEEELLPAVHFLAGELGRLFSRWQAALVPVIAGENGSGAEPRSGKLRLTEERRAGAAWQEEMVPPARELQGLCAPLLAGLQDLERELEKLVRDGVVPVEQFDFLLAELRGVGSRLQQQLGVFSRFFLAEQLDKSLIYWIETRGGRRVNFKVVLAPLEVGPLLVEKFYSRLETVVMTSATLAVSRDFGYFRRRCGLDHPDVCGQVVTLLLDSPFDYRRNCLLLVPSDLPEPGEPAFLERLVSLLAALVTAVGGRTLVLFTAYGMMNAAAERLRGQLAGRGFLLLKQGEAQRHRLLHDFKNNAAAVLLATASFWEGVDVKGRALETLVVVRLPFKVPTEPVVQARVEFIAASGGDPFRDYTLPQAAIKLKQGVGRLIRSRTDRGIVVVADQRLATRGYGRQLVNSLPMSTMQYLPTAELLAAATGFLSHGRS